MAGKEQHKMGMMGMMGMKLAAENNVVDSVPEETTEEAMGDVLPAGQEFVRRKKAHKKAKKGKMKAFMKGFMGNMRQNGKHAHMGKKKAHMGGKKKSHMGNKKKAHMGMMKRLEGVEGGEDLHGRSHHKNPAKYVRSLGHNIVTSLTTQTTTTLTVNTAAHNADSTDFMAVVPFMAYVGGNSGSYTCADSLGNTYTLASQVAFNSGYVVCLFYAAGVSSLAKNAIITVTHPASTRRIIMGDEFKNVEKTSAADQTAAAHNTVAATFATSGMTPITSQDKELLYGVIGVNGPSTDSFKKPSNWTLLHDRGTTASDGTDIRLITQFRTTGTTGTYEVSGTLGTGRLWGSITQTFKSEGGASDVSKD